MLKENFASDNKDKIKNAKILKIKESERDILNDMFQSGMSNDELLRKHKIKILRKDKKKGYATLVRHVISFGKGIAVELRALLRLSPQGSANEDGGDKKNENGPKLLENANPGRAYSEAILFHNGKIASKYSSQGYFGKWQLELFPRSDFLIGMAGLTENDIENSETIASEYVVNVN